MPSTNLRGGLPAHYRSAILRRVAAAAIRAGRRADATQRPSIRVAARAGKPEQTTTTDTASSPVGREPSGAPDKTTTTTTPRPEPRALPASPERPYVEIEAGTPDPEWEWVYRRPKP